MSETQFDPTKIPDPVLRQFAQRGTDDPTSVLIEFDSEMVVEFGEQSKFGPDRPSRRVVSPPRANSNEQMQSFADAIQQIIGAEPVRLDLAEALVADVTPAQLRAIASLPQVAAIRPNRTHRVGV